MCIICRPTLQTESSRCISVNGLLDAKGLDRCLCHFKRRNFGKAIVNHQFIQEEAVWTYEVPPNMILKPPQKMLVFKFDERNSNNSPKKEIEKLLLSAIVIEPVTHICISI